MIKWKKGIAAVGICLFVLGILNGCNKTTPQSLAGDVVKNSADIKSADADMTIDFQGSIPMDIFGEQESADFAMSTGMNIKCVQDPETAAAMQGSCQISAMSSQYDLDFESYTVKEEEQYVTYLNVLDQWIKILTEKQIRTDAVTQIALFREIADGGITAELDEELAKVNDKEAYVMRVTADGEFLEAFLLAQGEILWEKEDLDLSGIQAELVVYIDKDTRQLAKIEADGTELGMALFKNSDVGETVEVTSFCITVTVNSYNTAEAIQVPEDALENAAEGTDDTYLKEWVDGFGEEILGDTDEIFENSAEESAEENYAESEEAIQNKDGSYTIFSDIGSLQAIIFLPDEFEYESSTSVYLSADCYTKNAILGVQYCYDTISTMEEMAEYYCDLGYLENEESYANIVSSGETTMKVNKMEIHYVAIQYEYLEEDRRYPCMECYAWTRPEELSSPFVVGISYIGESGDDPDPETLVRQVYRGVTLK